MKLSCLFGHNYKQQAKPAHECTKTKEVVRSGMFDYSEVDICRICESNSKYATFICAICNQEDSPSFQINSSYYWGLFWVLAVTGLLVLIISIPETIESKDKAVMFIMYFPTYVLFWAVGDLIKFGLELCFVEPAYRNRRIFVPKKDK